MDSYNTAINLSWTIGTGANRTVIRWSSTAYPTSITDGTALYNGTGIFMNHTGLSPAHTYFYSIWSFASWDALSKYSTITSLYATTSYNTSSSFLINYPKYLEVGDYIFASGTITNMSGIPTNNIWVYTNITDISETVVFGSNTRLWVVDGYFFYIFSTSTMSPGIYFIHTNFTETGYEYNNTNILYLSFSAPPGIYSNALVYFNFYNTNIGLGLNEETFKVYVNDERNYENKYYGYISETINITIKDYYDSIMLSQNYTITNTYTGLNFGLTFHEYDFTNENDEYFYASFLKHNATRWYERVVSGSGGQKSFMLPSGNYTVRVYNSDSSTYISWTENINRSKAYLIGTDGVTLIIQGQSVIMNDLLEWRTDLSETLDYALMPDSIIISRNPPIVFSAFDRIGMMLGQNMYRICPPINMIAQTRHTESGNKINSTALIPSNGTVENGSITILEDIIYFTIVNGTVPTWVNITYTDNGTLIQNTTYVPTRFYPEGYNVTINASTDLSITRETRFNQLKKFYWDVYPGTDNPGWITETNGKKRTGYYRAGLELENTMNTIWYDVYVYAGYTPDTQVDLSTVRVTDVDNSNRILDEGENFKSTGNGIEFKLTGCIDIGETRNFLAEYYESFSDQYYYGNDVIHIDAYQTNIRHDDKLYNNFEYTWINTYDKTYRGSLSFYFDFPVETGIKQDEVIVYDMGSQQNITDFIISDQFLMIGSNTVGDVASGGGKTYSIYFKFDKYPGQDIEEMHLSTPLVTWGTIPISLFLIFVCIGLFLMIFGVLIMLYREKKGHKDYGKGLTGVGLLIAVITWILSTMGV